MGTNAVLCTNCGHDTRTGKSLGAVAAPHPAVLPHTTPAKKGAGKPKAPVDYMAPTGSITMGIILSAVLALVASTL